MGIRSALQPFGGGKKIKDFIENFDNFTKNEWEKSQSAQLGSVRPWHIVQADEKLNDYTATGIFGGAGVYCGSEHGIDYYTTLYRQMKLPKKFRFKTRFCFGVYCGGYGSQGGDWRLNLFSGSGLNFLDNTGWFINLNAPQSAGFSNINCTIGTNGNVQNTVGGLKNSGYNQYKDIIIDVSFDRTTNTYSGYVYNEENGQPTSSNVWGSLSGIDFKNIHLKYVMRSKFLWGTAAGGLGWTLIKNLFLTRK